VLNESDHTAHAAVIKPRSWRNKDEPGMRGRKVETFEIYESSKGTSKVFATK
jgi:hypothetical protein